MIHAPLIVPWTETPAPAEIETFCRRAHDELCRMLHQAAKFITRDEHLAEEAVQEAEIALFESLQNGKLKGNITPWLIRTVCNRAQFHARQEATRRHIDVANLVEDLLATPTLSPEAVEACAAVRQQLLALPDQMRRAFYLRAAEERDYAEIGCLLGCSPGTVRGYCVEAAKRLKNSLGEENSF